MPQHRAILLQHVLTADVAPEGLRFIVVETHA